MTAMQDDLTGYADDHALGLLTPAEAELFEALMAADPALAAHVGRLRDQLLPLDLSAAPVALPQGFAARLRAHLATVTQDAAPVAAGALSGDPTVVPVAANISAAPRRWLAGLAAALVLGIALGFGGALQRPAPAPQVVAVLLDDQGRARAVIEDFGDETAQIRFVSDIEVPPGFSIQAWTLPSAEMGPRSLGVLDGPRASRLAGPDLPAPADAQLYEITLEPLGGSPTGRPTGPIIAKGLAAAQGI
ncbi:anti-sigma factor domain-containing protein [Paracoccus nototheniae]|uniref:Anti-sigma factor domain-containing protein n=1 Tax=Paracoccus nototheniae TaxID=2489002 RepID=A0ABW4DVN1_9RHOB|nr:anti-sigma factor [Paracoccus nototheniae]